MNPYPVINDPGFSHDPTLAALLNQLQNRLHNKVCSTLVYGSCLRSGDIYDGLLDLYLICDNYRDAYRHRGLAAANWLLPPNVFYAQQKCATADAAGPTLRAKVTVISLRDFQRGCSTAWFESYIWGRFAQPTLILQARDADIRAAVETALMSAAYTLLVRALPTLPSTGKVTALWEDALSLSYATELRTERSGRAAELAHSAVDFYCAMTKTHASALNLELSNHENNGDLYYQHTVSRTRRTASKLGWGLRRIQGKVFSIARLVKALFTFEGGLDYIAWKLERHSGETVEIPPKVRKHPLLYLWPFFWGLYQRGIFK
ncbi:MAG: hypothetical protein AB8C02_01160 [Halioglobus sp.]